MTLRAALQSKDVLDYQGSNMARLVLYDEDLFVIIKALEQKAARLAKQANTQNRAINNRKRAYIYDLTKKVDKALKETVE